MFDFSKCHPIELNDLIRIGNENDGGYILSERQIKKTDVLLCFGLRDDWAFENSFSKYKDVRIYSYDFSTKGLPFLSRIFIKRFMNALLGAFISTLRFRPHRIRHYIRMFQGRKRFLKFFDGQKRHFIPKFLGRYDDEQNICFKSIFKELGETANLSVFLKMDIEGSEFETLPQLLPFLDKLNGMVIEFHIGENSKLDEFEILLDLFLPGFYISHIHGCNFEGYVQNTNIPKVLKISFINKKLVQGMVTLSKLEYPIKGLDAPDNPNKKDLVLKFKTIPVYTDI